MEVMERISKLQKRMREKKIAGLILQDPISIFYLTGLSPSSGKLLITSENKNKTHSKESHRKAFFFVDGRYFEALKKISPIPLFLLKEKAFENFLEKNLKKRAVLAFDSAACNYLAFETLKKSLQKMKKSSFKLVPWDSPLKEIRTVKDATEIAKLKKSAKLNFAGFKHIKKLLKVGVTEEELAFEFEFFVRKRGAEKTSFDPIIAFGENSACPHHKTGAKKLKKNEVVLMDLGVVVDGYCSDMTRTFFFGKVDGRLQEIYEVVAKAKKAALAAVKEGLAVEKLEKISRSVIEKAGYGDFYLHGLGHGVGLEVHEFPALSKASPDKKAKLKEGMVIAIEPGIYLPGLGGVRIEDTVAVMKKGLVNFYPKQV